MKSDARIWRRSFTQFGAAAILGCSLGCANSTQPTSATQNPPACSVGLWACTTSGFGAIAYSASTRAQGIAYNYSTRAEAEAAAIGYCAKSDCATAAWFQNACGAIATAPTGQMAAGTGNTGDSAQAFAMASCLLR